MTGKIDKPTKETLDRVSKDFGTRELARRFTVVPKLAGPNLYTGKVIDETEIDRLLLGEVITAAEHSSLEGFMRRLVAMGFVGLRSPDYQASSRDDPSRSADRKAKKLIGMSKLFRRLDEKIGPSRRTALVNLCLSDQPWTLGKDDLKASIARLEDAIAGR